MSFGETRSTHGKSKQWTSLKWRACAGRALPRPDFGGTSVEKYTVKVGDVCFVAIGQIVGRHYNAIRYQPTACIVINSPTHDPMICRQVRQLWTSDRPRQALLDSLLTDYATQGVFNGKSLDGWDLGSQFQIHAAMRLLYYFPKEAAPLIADRLRSFDVRATDDVDAFIHREVASGCRAGEFIKAVSWCREPAIEQGIKAIFSKTTDVQILLAALPGIGDADRRLIRDRLGLLLARVPRDEHGGYGDGYNLLTALADRLDKDAAPMFDDYLKGGSAQRGFSATMALREGHGKWRAAILRRLLDDTRSVGYNFAIHPDNQDVRLEMRVCDVAAESLSLLRPAFKFKIEGEYKDLDAQIERIRKEYDMAGNKP